MTNFHTSPSAATPNSFPGISSCFLYAEEKQQQKLKLNPTKIYTKPISFPKHSEQNSINNNNNQNQNIYCTSLQENLSHSAQKEIE